MTNCPKPIFIVGANRSGTTLLRLLLNAHSRIGIPEELVYFDSAIGGIPIERWQSPGLSVKQFETLVDEFIAKTCKILEGFNTRRLREVILEGPQTLRRPYEATLVEWARSQGKARWGEKTPGNLFYADVLHEMFPEAQFIYVVRDPRAGVNSMQKAPFFGGDIAFNALTRDKHYRAGRNVLERHVPSEQRMTVRYEDLVREPEQTVRKLCRFIGEEFEPTMLAFHENAGEYMKAEAANSFNAAATKPISTAMLDRWHQELSPHEIAVVQVVCEDEMRTHGYVAMEAHPPFKIRLDLYAKTAYWHLQCWRNRHIRHYTVKHKPFARLRHRLRRVLQVTTLGLKADVFGVRKQK